MAVEQQNGQNQLALVKKDVVDVVTDRVMAMTQGGQLVLPPNYAVQNSLKSAWLILQATKDKDGKLALQVCTKDSIANALLDMCVQGLNPAKKQGYFIPYGNQLTFQRSYFGTIAVAKQMAGVREVYPEVVYEGDQFEYTLVRGSRQITKHTQSLANVDGTKIVAAYCTVEFVDGREYTEIMTWDQIKKAWSKSKMNPEGANSTHKTFPEEMAKRTIINRALKRCINTSSDDHLFLTSFNRSDELIAEAELAEEAAANANGEIIDITTDVDAAEDETGADEQPQGNAAPEPAQAKPPTQGQRGGRQQTLGVGAQPGPGY